MHSNHRNHLKVAVAIELARAGLTQRQLAQQLGVPPTTLSTWLTGAHPAPGDLSTRIATALGIAPTQLLATH
jgi:transcriptional regulator with XRE-family HTH domain